jgi:hypothetical protein
MKFGNELLQGVVNINEEGKMLSYHSENLLIGYDKVPDQVISGHTKDKNFSFDFMMTDFRKFSTLKQASILTTIQIEESEQSSTNSVMNKVNNLLKQTIDTTIEMYYQTDNYCINLGEMITKIKSDHSYPNGINNKLIGYCKGLPGINMNTIDTDYSFKPNLSKVLQLEGENLLDQTIKINNKFNNVSSKDYKENCIFFKNILAYCTLRYMFAGLSNESVFSTKWLYSNNYNKFLRNLENSKFSAAVSLFTEPQKEFDFTDYNKYFKACVKHLQ